MNRENLRITSSLENPTSLFHRATLYIAIIVGFIVLLGTSIVIVPSVASAIREIKSNTTKEYTQWLTAPVSQSGQVVRVAVLLNKLDEVNNRVSLQVSGYRSCESRCAGLHDRLLIGTFNRTTRRIPAAIAIDIPDDGGSFETTLTLPLVEGSLMNFPFDQYTLNLGFVVERSENGTVRYLSQDDPTGTLSISIDESMRRIEVDRPSIVDPNSPDIVNQAVHYTFAAATDFRRPLYVKTYVVLIVLLLAMATFYTVTHSSFDKLIMNTGGMILGLWGARSLISGEFPPDVTLIDLILSLIVICILFSVTLHAVFYYCRLLRNPNP